MEAFELQKKANFEGDVEILERLAAQGVNILGIVPLVAGDSDGVEPWVVMFLFEYLYRGRNGNINWRKGTLRWCLTNSSMREGLHYVSEVTSELQSRLGQDAEC